MAELFEQYIKKLSRQSSKGNQLKWENEGIWYKADFLGYEGLAEYVISHLLKKSTLSEDEFVLYDLEEIHYKSTVYNGAKSDSFLEKGWQVITLERLYQNLTGESLYKTIFSIEDHAKRFDFLVEQVEQYTGLKNFNIYLNKLFTIDAFFLNEDRHMHNIAVLMNEVGEFEYCPIFDNGAGLLADTMQDYPLGRNVYEQMDEVQAKTICFDFDEQLEISEAKSNVNLRFTFTKDDVDQVIDGATIYSEEERERVRTIIYTQMRKYAYLTE